MRCVIVVVNEGRRSGSKSSDLFLLFFGYLTVRPSICSQREIDHEAKLV